MSFLGLVVIVVCLGFFVGLALVSIKTEDNGLKGVGSVTACVSFVTLLVVLWTEGYRYGKGMPREDTFRGALAVDEVYRVTLSVPVQKPVGKWLVGLQGRENDAEVVYYLLDVNPPSVFQRKKDNAGKPVYAPFPGTAVQQPEAKLEVQLSPQR